MAFIDSLLSLLRNSTPSKLTYIVFDERTGEFLPIDFDVAKRNLNLTEYAIENGKKHIPLVKTSTKDATATNIDRYINDLVYLAKGKLINRLEAIDDLNRIQLSSRQYINEIFEKARAEIRATARERYNALFTAKRKWVLGESEFKAFRDEHYRKGPARYPADKTKNFGYIFLITIFEILMNAYALGAAHPSGSIGVILEIFMFGIVNVGVAFFLGCYVWRYFYHISTVKKTVATVLVVPMVSFIVFLNFFLAHYRDAISKLAHNELGSLQLLVEMQRLGGQAIKTLLQNPFLMEDFKSYLLLFVGLLASTLAAMKSFELDDPYPGYGKLSREQDELATNFNDEQTFALRDINELVDNYSNQINSELVNSDETPLIRRENDKKQLFDKYNNWLAATQSVGKALYAFYREENMKARKIKEEPKCFSSTNFNLPSDAKVKLENPKPKKSNYGAIERTCKECIDSLNKLSTNFQSEFKDIENMSPDKVLSDEFKIPTVFKD